MSQKGNRRKGKHRVPSVAATAAQPKKIPRVDANVDYWGSHPIWSFAILDRFAPVGGWIHLDPMELDSLLPRLCQLETMTWAEILSDGRTQNHAINVDKLIPEAQERLKFLNLDDYEEVLSLRVTAKARIYGIRDGAIFRILWWDPEHKICPAPLKHT